MGVLCLVAWCVGILIFLGLTARRLYKSFGVKWLKIIPRVFLSYTYVCCGVDTDYSAEGSSGAGR
jgi:hypothetical protein